MYICLGQIIHFHWHLNLRTHTLKEIKIMGKKENSTIPETKREGSVIREKKKLTPIVSGVLMACSLMSTQVMAATDTSSVTAPLDSLKTLVIAIIGAVGVIILAKNVMEFAQAYQQQDSSTMNSALKGIVAGVMMAGISSVLTILGF